MSTNRKRPLSPPHAKPSGPYSPGLQVGDLVFVAGQGPLDPATKRFALGTIEQQTALTLLNVQAVLREAACEMDDCVKTTVHLADIRNFDRFNAVYRAFFHEPYPVRTTVQSVLGSGIAVEIDAIAVRGSRSPGASAFGAGLQTAPIPRPKVSRHSPKPSRKKK